MSKSPRVGPRMQDVLDLVASGPRTRIDIARSVGPNGSLRFGYAIVQRALDAGIVRTAPPLPGRRGLSIEAAAS